MNIQGHKNINTDRIGPFHKLMGKEKKKLKRTIKTKQMFHSVVYRDQDPQQFWKIASQFF
jgi:hypothetical protein